MNGLKIRFPCGITSWGLSTKQFGNAKNPPVTFRSPLMKRVRSTFQPGSIRCYGITDTVRSHWLYTANGLARKFTMSFIKNKSCAEAMSLMRQTIR